MQIIHLLLIALTCTTLHAEFIPEFDALPLHEAFVTSTSNIEPLQVIDHAPPAPLLDKIPPQKDTNTHWIPGYWSYIPQQRDFVWISGIWRNVPPEMKWVPGLWKNVDGGWVWLKGFWYPENSPLQFAQTPPPVHGDETQENTPNGDFLFARGYWTYENGKYHWLQGAWIAADRDWVFNQAYYIWRPEGYLLIPSYWDFPLEERGSLYTSNKIVLDSNTILKKLLPYYPNYTSLFWHYFHFNPKMWEKCWCTPVWWKWDSFWTLTTDEEWGLWWWYTHPGYPQPAWLSKNLSYKIAPPSSKLIDFMAKVTPPVVVTPKGVPTSADWLKTIQQVTHAQTPSPLIPLNKKEAQEIKTIAAQEVHTILHPEGTSAVPQLTIPMVDLKRDKVAPHDTIPVLQKPTKQVQEKPSEVVKDVTPVIEQKKEIEIKQVEPIHTTPVQVTPKYEPQQIKIPGVKAPRVPATARRGGNFAPPTDMFMQEDPSPTRPAATLPGYWPQEDAAQEKKPEDKRPPNVHKQPMIPPPRDSGMVGWSANPRPTYTGNASKRAPTVRTVYTVD